MLDLPKKHLPKKKQSHHPQKKIRINFTKHQKKTNKKKLNHMTNQRIITAPVLIPNTPDCDYTNGEPPLTPKEIKHLQQTYKNYQIIDYQHKYIIQGPYYKRKIGTPIKSWITTKTHTYTDILNNTQTTPPGT